VQIKVNYPLTFTFRGQAPTQKFFEFTTKKQVRLKKMLELSDAMITNELRNLTFDIARDFETLKGSSSRGLLWDSFLTVAKSETPPCFGNCPQFEGKYDDMISVHDSKSLLKAQEYSFQFAIKNRKPVLNLIKHTDLGGKWDALGYDIAVQEGDEIEIKPYAVDPDGDSINFSYEGWKETYDARWDVNSMSVVNIPDVQPHNWTNSSVFDPLTGHAIIQTTPSDIGVHNVTVIVTDDEGQTDWQVVTIFVAPVPILRAATGNIYDDIRDNLAASIEDPYWLDATKTEFRMQQGKLEFMWSDDVEQDFSVMYDEAWVPDESIITQGESIKEMLKHVFTVTLDVLPFFKEHTLTLKVSDVFNNEIVTSSSLELDPIKVYQCLPHRSNDLIFPYIKMKGNDYSDDTNKFKDFMADHTCCQGEGLPEGELGQNIFVYVASADVSVYDVLRDKLEDEGYSVDVESNLPNSVTLEDYDQLWIIGDDVSSSIDSDIVDDFKNENKGVAIFTSDGNIGSVNDVVSALVSGASFEESACSPPKPSKKQEIDNLLDGLNIFSQTSTVKITGSGFRVLVYDTGADCSGSNYVGVVDLTPSENGRVILDASLDRVKIDNVYDRRYVRNVADWLSRTKNPTSGLYWGAFANSSTLCYTNNGALTCYPHLPTLTNTYDPLNIALQEEGGELVPYEDDITQSVYRNGVQITEEKYQNDIFNRTFVQNCSGNRGNVCSGGASDRFEHLMECDDSDLDPDNEDERCQGPCKGCHKSNCPSINKPASASCYNYTPGKSFELTFQNYGAGSGDIDGICNPDWKPSEKGDVFKNNNYIGPDGSMVYGRYGMVDGPFKCQAQCYEGKCRFAANCYCDSTTANGGDSECDDVKYDDLYDNGGYYCISETGITCDTSCNIVDADNNKEACECKGGTYSDDSTYNFPFPDGTTGKCCGDVGAEFFKERIGNVGGQACCSNADSCVDNTGDCVRGTIGFSNVGEAGPFGQHDCDTSEGVNCMDYCVDGLWKDCKDIPVAGVQGCGEPDNECAIIYCNADSDCAQKAEYEIKTCISDTQFCIPSLPGEDIDPPFSIDSSCDPCSSPIPCTSCVAGQTPELAVCPTP